MSLYLSLDGRQRIKRGSYSGTAHFQHMRVYHRRGDVGMAEQILQGSHVVTAAEQGRRERVAQGMRCGGLRDTCLFYGTFEGAGRSGHPCDGDARRRFVGRSNACAAQEPRTTAKNVLRADTSAPGRQAAPHRRSLRPGPSATMPGHAPVVRAGQAPSSRATSVPDPWSPCPPAR